MIVIENPKIISHKVALLLDKLDPDYESFTNLAWYNYEGLLHGSPTGDGPRLSKIYPAPTAHSLTEYLRELYSVYAWVEPIGSTGRYKGIYLFPGDTRIYTDRYRDYDKCIDNLLIIVLNRLIRTHKAILENTNALSSVAQAR